MLKMGAAVRLQAADLAVEHAGERTDSVRDCGSIPAIDIQMS